jgi:hypothetical protein
VIETTIVSEGIGIGVIVEISVGGFSFVVIIAVALFCYLSRRRSWNEPQLNHPPSELLSRDQIGHPEWYD